MVTEERFGLHAVAIFHKALAAVDPYRLVAAFLAAHAHLIAQQLPKKIKIIGIGKAAAPMIAAFAHHLSFSPEGVVLTKYGHLAHHTLPASILCFEAGHPLPDGEGVHATQTILQSLQRTEPTTTTFVCISGGASALLVCPTPPLTLAEKQVVTEQLLRCGATINELNTVRKHLSRVKGGRLAEVTPGKVISLILSDVIGDPLDIIGSGPTAADPSTYADALAIVDKYGLAQTMPPSALQILKEGLAGRRPETPKPGAPVFKRTQNIIIGNNKMALTAATEAAERTGYRTIILSDSLTGEASAVGTRLAEIARQYAVTLPEGSKLCLLAGGETTVTVQGKGLGGRNTEMALAFAIAIKGEPGITFLSAGTDGTDGPTDAAGAWVDGNTYAAALVRGLSPEEYLKNNDSYTFFKALGNLVITGPTGTNVMDIQIILIDGAKTRTPQS